MERIKLEVTGRSEIGTSSMQKLRSRGLLPGIVYGKAKEPLPVKVSMKDIHSVKGGQVSLNALLDLVITGEKESLKKTVIVKEIQTDPVRGDWLHIDFNEISLKEKLKTPVQIELTGDAKGVSEGGVLEQIMFQLEVECLPTDIPKHILVDVSSLSIGQTLYVKDLVIPEKVIVLSNLQLPVVSVSAPRAEEVVAAPVTAEAGAQEPEVIGKGKKEEEEVEEGAETKPKAEPKAKAAGEEKEKK